MINLELYRIFYEVASAKNITKASKNLNISQPAITKHIKNLENELNTPLFIRTKKGVILNESGKKIYLKVKTALNLLNEAEKSLDGINNLQTGTIKIGISTTLAKKFLFSYLKSFRELYPNIIINIYTDPTKTLIEELKNGEIDFIIGKFSSKKDNDLEYYELGKTNYIFVGNKKYFDLTKKEITVKELANYPILLQKEPSNSRQIAKKYFEENNIQITPKMNIASSNLLIEFTSIGYGIGFVTKLYVDKELKNKELYEINVKPQTPRISYGIISLKNNIMSLPCKTFIEHIKTNKKWRLCEVF